MNPFVYTGQLPNVVLAGTKTLEEITVCSPPFHTLRYMLLRPIKYGIISDQSKIFFIFWKNLRFFTSTLGTVDTYADLPTGKNTVPNGLFFRKDTGIAEFIVSLSKACLWPKAILRLSDNKHKQYSLR